jgi:hypothetical protein
LLAVTECIAPLRCTALVDSMTWEQCFEESAEAIHRSATCFEFCDVFGRHTFECFAPAQVDDAQEECVEDWGCIWSDPVLREALACLDANDCETRSRCLEGVWAL